MKTHVLFDVLQLVSFLQEFLGAVDAGGEVAEKSWSDVGGFDGVDFKNLAEFVEVANLLCGKLPHVGAAPGFDNDEAFRVEPIQRLAYWRLADSKLRGKRFLGEAGEFAKGSIEQILLNAAIGEFGEIRNLGEPKHDGVGFVDCT